MSNPAPSSSPMPIRGWGARLMEACRGPRALPAFGMISFLESSFLPIPIDVALVPLCLARPRQLWLIILVGTIGSVLGAILGYLIGAFFMDTAGRWLLSAYGMTEDFEAFRSLYGDNGWMAVVIGGITPIPFKAVAIVSGAATMRFDLFLMAAFGIRFIRFGLIVAMIRLIGPSIQLMLDKNGKAFTFAMLVITALGILATPLLF